MTTFIMLTRLTPESARSPKALEELERQAMGRVRKDCPSVEWVSSYAILGPYDYLDVFRASDIETACKVSTLIPDIRSRPDRDLVRHGMGEFQRDRAGSLGSEVTGSGDASPIPDPPPVAVGPGRMRSVRPLSRCEAQERRSRLTATGRPWPVELGNYGRRDEQRNLL